MHNLWSLAGRQSLVSGPASPSPDSPRAVIPPSGVIQLNDSVWELHSPGGNPNMEIIFFPGLQLEDFSNSFWKTWLAMDDEHVVWPKEVLSTMFPAARILCISYQEVAGQTDKSDIDILGESLVHDIIQDRNHNIGQHCPVFLVGHSLGGTVIKNFVLSAYEKCDLFNNGNFEEDIDTFLENIRGVFYYAAPNGGSRIAELASQITSSSPILELLKKVNAVSGTINEEFRQQRVNLILPSFAVAEGCKTQYGAFDAMVVDEASAQLDVEKSYVHTTANHFTVCRAKSVEDVAIEKLVKFIASKAFIPPAGVTEVGDKGHIEQPDHEELPQGPKKESQASAIQLPAVTKYDDEGTVVNLEIQPAGITKYYDEGNVVNLEVQLAGVTKYDDEANVVNLEQLDLPQDLQEVSLASTIPLSGGSTATDEKGIAQPCELDLGHDTQELSLSGTIPLPGEVKVDEEGTVMHPQHAELMTDRLDLSVPAPKSLPGLTKASDEVPTTQAQQDDLVQDPQGQSLATVLPPAVAQSLPFEGDLKQEAGEAESSSRPPDKKVILFGQTGDGKSTVANVLVTGGIEQVVFPSGGTGMSCTKSFQIETGRGWTVVDTPVLNEYVTMTEGRWDSMSTAETQKAIKAGLKDWLKQTNCKDGYSHIIFVSKARRITTIEQFMFHQFCTLFEGAEDAFVFLFTAATELWLDENRDRAPMTGYPILGTDIPPIHRRPVLEEKLKVIRERSIQKLEADLEDLFRKRQYKYAIPKIALDEREQEKVVKRLIGRTTFLESPRRWFSIDQRKRLLRLHDKYDRT
ncbi:unnamed protein product [Calypogeia fissa]